VTGGAGALAACQIRVPLNTNIIGVIEKLSVSSNVQTMAYAFFDAGAADLTTPAGAVPMDKRQTANPVSNVSSQTTSPGGSSGFYNAEAIVNTEFDLIKTIDQELVLNPGHGVLVLGQTNAGQMFVNFMWRERFLEEGERL
jgi:hypothetical protein